MWYQRFAGYKREGLYPLPLYKEKLDTETGELKQSHFDGIVSILGLEDETEVLLDALFGIIISAGLNPAIAPFIIAILDFYVEEVSIDFTVALVFNINAIQNGQVDFWRVFRPEPLDVLILWTYAIVAKILFKAWIVPSVTAFRSSIRP